MKQSRALLPAAVVAAIAIGAGGAYAFASSAGSRPSSTGSQATPAAFSPSSTGTAQDDWGPPDGRGFDAAQSNGGAGGNCPHDNGGSGQNGQTAPNGQSTPNGQTTPNGSNPGANL